MIRQNLFISSFKTLAWIFFWLIIWDLFLGQIIYPWSLENNHRSLAKKVQDYLETGFSQEERMFQTLNNPLALECGWLEDARWEEADSTLDKNQKNGPIITFYGMSFSSYIAEAMKIIRPEIQIRLVNAPAAPPNHSYTAFLMDTGRKKSDIVVLTILASSVKGMLGTGHGTINLHSYPHTYPRYVLEEDRLEKLTPVITTKFQFLQALEDKTAWNAYTQTLAKQDLFFHPFVFHRSWMDQSVLLRICRSLFHRYRVNQLVEEKVGNKKGFYPDSEVALVLKKMVKDFAAKAKHDQQIPIVLLINSRGFSGQLYELLRETLIENKIKSINTDEFISSSNPFNFYPDGHFTTDCNQKIAQGFYEKLVSLGLIR